jgi:hypothetical protein
MAGSTYVTDLSEGAVVDATFAVQRKTQRRTRNGDPFLSVELADRTGRVPGVVWNDVNLLGARFDQGDTVRVLGRSRPTPAGSRSRSATSSGSRAATRSSSSPARAATPTRSKGSSNSSRPRSITTDCADS